VKSRIHLNNFKAAGLRAGWSRLVIITEFQGASVNFSAFICLLSVAFLIFSSFTLQAKEISAGIYTYRETVGETTTSFYWKVEEKEQQKIVSVEEKGKSFINLCSDDGATWEWQLTDSDNKHDVIAKRQGNELTISGTCDGKTCEETVELDERPWYQPLSYSLRNFLSSDRKSISFWTIRADTLEVTTMKVEKQGEEEILINEKTIPAFKVELRAEGFYSHFWHGTYWYRKSDNLFLMYRSVHGPVGTPETIVELMKEPGVQADSQQAAAISLQETGSDVFPDKLKGDG
jgi:hypothetical protein